MQHDQTERLQNDDIQPVRESKLTAVTKISKNNNTTFFQNVMEYLAETLYEAYVGP